MTSEQFLQHLQLHAESFAAAVATNEGDWIIKGFIDIHEQIYTISIDTKVVSKVLELLLFPMFVEFGQRHGLKPVFPKQQNSYPDLTFIEESSGNKFAVDIKSTYRVDAKNVNGMTLGAFTGYFRNRKDDKNIEYPYEEYQGHFVLGVIYSHSEESIDERKKYALKDIRTIPSVIKDFRFFAQPKYCIAATGVGSGNTKNIGSSVKIDHLLNGTGVFAKLGEEVFDDYWMYYLTRDMAEALKTERPYINLKTYYEYKERGIDKLREHAKDISAFDDEANPEKDPQ
ncbi:MAG: restriction endonuclease [Sideroxydans sp.]|nr:restriction endonuclease [Sideroxydans sp.]